MVTNCAIAIGINQYKHLKSLQYAKRDAMLVQNFLVKDARFDQVYYFSDDSQALVLDGGVTVATKPTISNLRRFFEVRFATPFLKPGDNVWFFFFGHGLQFANWDYLMPSDADPGAAEPTGISIDYVVDCLKKSGATNVVLVLDACRTEEQKFGQGFGTDPQGVVTIFSSGFGETSYEVDGLQHGSLAYALLEGLKDKSKDATLEQLYRYLHERVPQLNLRYNTPPQIPRLSAEPSLKLNEILIPRSLAPSYKNWLKPTAQRSEEQLTDAEITNFATFTSRNRSTKTFLAELAGLVTLAGVLGYVAYQTWDPSPLGSSLSKLNSPAAINTVISPAPATSRPSPRVLPSVLPDAAKLTNQGSKVFASTTPSNQAGVASGSSGDIYHRLPRTGTYYAPSSLLSSSRREIGSGNDRLCIKIVNGPPARSSGYQQVLVSSLSVRKDGIYIDATNDKLAVDTTYTEFTDPKGTWQFLDRRVDLTGLMAQCLAANESYRQQAKGDFIQGNQ